MGIKRNHGISHKYQDPRTREEIISYINMKMAALGWPVYTGRGQEHLTLAEQLIRNLREKNRILDDYLPPVDQRVQRFLDSYLADTGLKVPRLPSNTLVLDRYGMARELSMPPEAHKFQSEILTSYRVKQGVLHNPLNDRRTTKGVFHVAEGGLPIPPDKKAVPKAVFSRLLEAALNPPAELSQFPFTADQDKKASGFVSLLLRPVVCPPVPGVISEKAMEIRFFAPGNLVSNLDFVESIFGNAGDPYLPENDAGLDPEHWTGHSGCIILATHLTTLKKKDLGLPSWEEATARQKADGMAWKDPSELYNDGSAFKICARDDRGVMITLIADNYYGYSKKEVKTQISYSANLWGLAEEEHAGGALAFPAFNHGMKFLPESDIKAKGHTFAQVKKLLGDHITVHPEGYGTDKRFPEIVYLHEDAQIHLEDQIVTWHHEGKDHSIKVLPGKIYVHPSGYKVHMEKHPTTTAWRLVGTAAEGTLCHKPCTVSGGGKSEISKSIWDAIHFNPIFIGDFETDMARVETIVDNDFARIWQTPPEDWTYDTVHILDEDVSLNEVIQWLTPSKAYTSSHNQWLETIPSRIKALVYLVKRFYYQNPDWKGSWRDRFSVDVVNGSTGNVFKYNDRPIMGAYLRVGLREDGSGWTYKLRQDFMPAFKIQWEDDISASVVIPAKQLEHLNPEYRNPSVKFALNCESRFFQRPDDAVHRGYDKQAEADLAGAGNFISNFEPFEKPQAQEFVDNALSFFEYTKPMQKLIASAAADPECAYFVVSSHPRIVDGAPSKNPRYLQLDPNHTRPRDKYLAEVGTRLARQVPQGKAVYFPINAVLPGRRNNPADHKTGIRPLAVYGPIHFQELPELFMDFVTSLTGKSPSTTGAGTEGALTKGPFNALVPTTDLNNSLLSFILTGYNGFSSAAGYIGHKYKVEHDISLLMPEVWCRMSEKERDPLDMIAKGYLEKLEDFDYQGKKIPASRLGFRITYEFATRFLARLFDDPGIVFNPEMLQPELQSLEDYVDGIMNIVETQQKVAQAYLDDRSFEAAIPPLKALLVIMAQGTYEGKDIHHPEIRALFDRETVLVSSWYQDRLVRFRDQEIQRWSSHQTYLKQFLDNPKNQAEVRDLDLQAHWDRCQTHLKNLQTPEYLNSLAGTLGLDPLCRL